MRLAKATTFFFTLVIFLMPAFFATASDSPKDITSICDVTMAHDSLVADFMPASLLTINEGEDFVAKINISNKTSYAYKNTRILAKVFFLGDTNFNVDSGGQLVDVQLLKESYDVNGGSNKEATLTWKSSSVMQSGTYRMDIYTVQNGIHVIGDFARSDGPKKSTFFNVVGINPTPVISVLTEKTLLAETPYEVVKMLSFSEEDTNDNVKVFVKSSSTKDIIANIEWKVYNYGQFDEANILLSTSTQIVLHKNKETQIDLKIPLSPSNRYHAILDIEEGGIHTIEIMRWGREAVSPSSLDTFGIVEDGEFLTNEEIPKDFALKPGKRYVAFACVIGGYRKANTTISMRLRDEDGNVIFSREETKLSGTEIAAYEYPFIPTKFSKRIQLDVTAMTGGFETKASWLSDCKDNISGVCKDDSFLKNIKLSEVVPFIIIAFMFLVVYVIRNLRVKLK